MADARELLQKIRTGLKPLIFLTNCSDAARISSPVNRRTKLKSILIFLHIRHNLRSLRTLKGAPKKH